MKKILLTLFILLYTAIPSFSQKVTSLTEDTSPSTDDLVMTVDNPSGTPTSKKSTLASIKTAIVKDITMANINWQDSYNLHSTVNWYDADIYLKSLNIKGVSIGNTSPDRALTVESALETWNSPYSFNNGMRSYIGFVATRGEVPTNTNTVSQMMSRSVHYSTTDITRLKIGIPNWWVNSSSPFQELGTGGTATVTASIEYPAGTFTQVLFNGSSSGSIPDLTTLVSDWVSVTIPNNTKFFVRIYFVNSVSVIPFSTTNPTSSAGSGVEAGNSGITDKTLSGTVSSSNTHLSPVFIIGDTDQASVVFIGDSKCIGTNDTTVDSHSDYGELAKSFGLKPYGYSLTCRGSDSASKFILPDAANNRLAIWKYATHIVNGYGYNDIWNDGSTASVTMETMQTIYKWAHQANKKVYQITIGPKTTSTDSFATTANQTISNTTRDTNRKAFNALVRTNRSGADGYFELADSQESARDSGKWNVDGTPNKYTSDGIHESSFTYNLERTNEVIPRTIFDSVILYNNNNINWTNISNIGMSNINWADAYGSLTGRILTRTATGVNWSDIPASVGGGGVSSVTGTAPILSSGGTTPAISINWQSVNLLASVNSGGINWQSINLLSTINMSGINWYDAYNLHQGVNWYDVDLTMKTFRSSPNVATIADATSFTPLTAYTINSQINTQATGTLTINAPVGLVRDGMSLMIRIKSTNVQTLSWNSVFRAGTNALPTATTGSSKYDYFTFIYNSDSAKWDFTGSGTAF